MTKDVRVYLGSDHAGFFVKEKIKHFLDKKGISYQDYSREYIDKDDYPDYAFEVAEKVAKNKDSRGILVCGTGTGMVMAANKVKGVRAAVIYDKYSAEMARKHNDANIACLRGRRFLAGKDVKLVEIFLNTEFSYEERHRRRLAKIERYEK